jgi:hypothetical protein
MFKKGNFKRICMVLGVLQRFESVHIVDISKLTDMPRSSVQDLLQKLIDGQVPGVKVSRQDSTYTLEEWSDFQKAVEALFTKNCADKKLLKALEEEKKNS